MTADKQDTHDKNPPLDPRLADPFEVYHGVFVDKARWQWMSVTLVVANIVLVAALTLSSLRPPQVIIKDRIGGEAPKVMTMGSAPAISDVDARVFFLNMLKLRFGWDSLTVDRDMQAFLGQCFVDQRNLEVSHLQEVIDVDVDASPNAKRLPRMQAWITSGIKNTLLLPKDFDDVQCKRQDGAWHCYIEGSIVTSRMLPPFKEAAAPKSRLAFIATLLEVRHTMGTPSGLIVGAMRQVPLTHSRQGA